MITLTAGGVRMAFTDRHAGVSLSPAEVLRLGTRAADAVRRRRRADVARGFGLSPDRVVFLRQVHGADVSHVTGPFLDTPPALDGAWTDRAGLAIAVLVADCAPVLLADPVAGLVGAAHAGRMGIAAGVVSALVAAMEKGGAVPSRMTALIGPAACVLCYEVSVEIREVTAAAVPEAWGTTRRGTPGVDLRAAVAGQLSRSGVGDVRHDGRCTVESADLYSYRREGPTGDFAGYVWRA
ncbi:polyphenol oxidase family protein [Nonomuraea helvata]|uniref:Polyphenol oxidase family protein n=1 Tax=Nonomuraea helvata TaxID=37484 RepID=A0ABV5SAB2_9ACTN